MSRDFATHNKYNILNDYIGRLLIISLMINKVPHFGVISTVERRTEARASITSLRIFHLLQAPHLISDVKFPSPACQDPRNNIYTSAAASSQFCPIEYHQTSEYRAFESYLGCLQSLHDIDEITMTCINITYEYICTWSLSRPIVEL